VVAASASAVVAAAAFAEDWYTVDMAFVHNQQTVLVFGTWVGRPSQ
jgi:hypothetical protein